MQISEHTCSAVIVSSTPVVTRKRAIDGKFPESGLRTRVIAHLRNHARAWLEKLLLDVCGACVCVYCVARYRRRSVHARGDVRGQRGAA